MGRLRRGALVGARAVGRGVLSGVRMNSTKREKSLGSEGTGCPSQAQPPACASKTDPKERGLVWLHSDPKIRVHLREPAVFDRFP